MSQKMMTVPISANTSHAILEIAKEWGYKKHGNGGKTGFVADLLECVVATHQTENPAFDLTLLIRKKPEGDE